MPDLFLKHVHGKRFTNSPSTRTEAGVIPSARGAWWLRIVRVIITQNFYQNIVTRQPIRPRLRLSRSSDSRHD
jgi:hypothetical protein